MSPLKLYEELAEWWPLLSPPEEYVDEVAFFLEALHVPDQNPDQLPTLVEFGCGGGSNAYHLKKHFTMTLTDVAPNMVAVSRVLNPECEHIVGDMRSLQLGRQFDVVFIHDAIDYMTTESDLRMALENAYHHCKPGGTALFVPDNVRENFESTTDHGGHDGEGRALRYMEWHFDPDPTDSVYTTHYVFMLRHGEAVYVEHDQHECGLFARAEWLRLLGEVGFHPKRLVDVFERDVFVAYKPIT